MWVGLVRSKIIFTYAVLPFARVYGMEAGCSLTLFVGVLLRQVLWILGVVLLVLRL